MTFHSPLRHFGAFTLLLAGLGFHTPTAIAATTQPTSVEGELEVLVEDYQDGRSTTRHFLKTARGRMELRFSRKPTDLTGGARVRVRGRQQAGDVLAIDFNQGDSMQVVSAAPAATFGQQDVAVLLVNFQDDASQAQTPSAVESLVFGSINAYFRESSFDQAWLSGRVHGWYTLPMSKSVCDPYAMADLADKAATDSGVNLSAYRRKLYIFPRNACGWAGLGNVGGSTTRAWSNGYYSNIVIGHELGHNFGLHHAQALNCDTGAMGGTCTTLAYGDTADLMGNYRAAHVSPFAKERLGWLNDGVSPPILSAMSNGRYAIELYSSTSVGAKAVKIPRGVDASGRKLWYYLEYRQAIGGDSVLANTGNLTRGVVVRVATEGDASSSRQLDMTPGSSTNTYTELADGALAVGQTYTDAAAGVSFSLASADAAGASIDVSFGAAPPTCTRNAPSIALAGGGTAVSAGSAIAYSVSVTNRDSAACSATSFNLAGSVPSGWTAQLGTTALALSPGSSANTTLTVTSAANATAGTHGVGVGIASAAGAVHTASASATYSVAAAAGGTLSNALGTDKAVYARGETASFSALVKRDGVAVPGATVKFTVTLPNGSTSLLSATSGSDGYARARYKLGKGKGASGGYGVRADASQGGASASATASFTVN